MGFAVCNGAMCQCSFGAVPSFLVVNSVTNVLGSNMPVASIMDNTAVNIASFGTCMSLSNPAVASATSAALGVLTPQPCSPVIVSPWAAGSPTVIVSNKPALNDTSKTSCAYGGIIQIVNPAQQTVQIP